MEKNEFSSYRPFWPGNRKQGVAMEVPPSPQNEGAVAGYKR
jgi:hypothetical protein